VWRTERSEERNQVLCLDFFKKQNISYTLDKQEFQTRRKIYRSRLIYMYRPKLYFRMTITQFPLFLKKFETLTTLKLKF